MEKFRECTCALRKGRGSGARALQSPSGPDGDLPLEVRQRPGVSVRGSSSRSGDGWHPCRARAHPRERDCADGPNRESCLLAGPRPAGLPAFQGYQPRHESSQPRRSASQRPPMRATVLRNIALHRLDGQQTPLSRRTNQTWPYPTSLSVLAGACEAFTIDEGKEADEKRFDGVWALRVKGSWA